MLRRLARESHSGRFGRSRRSLKPTAAHYAQAAFEHADDLNRRVFVAISESVSRFNLTHDICAPSQFLGCYQ